TQYAVPSSSYDQMLNSIVTGPDGNLWFIAGSENVTYNNWLGNLYRITPEGQLTAFQAPVGGHGQDSNPGTLTAGPDGNLWFPVIGGVCRFSLSGQWTVFPSQPNVTMSDLIAGPDGNLWFTYSTGNTPEAQPPESAGVGYMTPDGTSHYVAVLP